MSLKLPLRPNVCIILVNKDNKIFLGERLGEPGVWQLPQGGVEAGMTLEENVLKELNEETGADKKHFVIIKKLQATNEYEFGEVPNYAKGKWRGQAQTFWLVRYTGEDSDFNLAAYEPEFQNFCWCKLDDIEKTAEPKRYQGYKNALSELNF